MSPLPSSLYLLQYSLFFFFFFNDTATTEIYTLSLHDALPILWILEWVAGYETATWARVLSYMSVITQDRKSTRLNSSHGYISYAVFCLKKKKNTIKSTKPIDDIRNSTTTDGEGAVM